MAKLCPECLKKPADTSVAGRCQTPTKVVPQGHLPYTDSPSFTMCDACCEEFDRCARCGGPLSGGGSGVIVPTEKQFVRVTKDGENIPGMNVGEQILIEKYVDLYSGMTWRVKSHSYGVKLYGWREVAVPNSSMIKREMYFDLTTADPKAFIELSEEATHRWASGVGGTFRCTMEVKQ